MQVVRYEERFHESWDALVASSSNGTFLLLRDYMDYHRERFNDCSLLFYDGKDLAGLLPATLSDDVVTSHAGLTYGGLVTCSARYAQTAAMLDAACSYCREQLGARHFVVKPIPYIYNRYPAEEQLYWLFRHGATLCSRSMSTAIDLSRPLPLSTLRRRHAAKAQREGLTVREAVTAHDWSSFWTLLSETLATRHGVQPVHSFAEMQLLQTRFPQNIRLFLTIQGTDIVAGSVLYVCDRVVHAQYIAANAAGRQLGALDLLFATVLSSDVCCNRAYFDFGISTEQGGQTLNDGLQFQKEGFGARAVCYDVYDMPLQP